MQPDLVGRTLGQYRLEALIGKGGMAAVYRAYQPALERYVALKLLPAYFVHDSDFLERFRREARAVAQLEQPNILPIYDFGEQDGIPYIVMPLVVGGTLRDRIGHPLALDWSLEICAGVAQALDYAHARGVVHRDVKPSNILLGPGDWPLLADFGIAKMVGESRLLTQHGVGVGTPEYMSPEQGHGLPVDGRTDQYALAMTLFEMLTGSVPFRGETPIATVLKQINEPVPHLGRPDLPPAIDEVLQHALAKRPEDRFPSAGDMVAALRRVAQSTPSSSATPLDLDVTYAAVLRAMQAEDWETAITSCVQLLAVDPMYRDVDRLLAQCRQQVIARRAQEEQLASARRLLADRRPREALDVLRELERAHPTGPELRVLLEEADTAAREQAAAERRAQELERLYTQAEAALQREHLEEALRFLQRIAAQGPDFRDVATLIDQIQTTLDRRTRQAALFVRAQQAVDRQDYTAAIADLELLLAEAPDHSRALALLSRARRAQEASASAATVPNWVGPATGSEPAVRPFSLASYPHLLPALGVAVIALVVLAGGLVVWWAPLRPAAPTPTAAGGGPSTALTPSVTAPTNMPATPVLAIIPPTAPLAPECQDPYARIDEADAALARGATAAGHELLQALTACPEVDRGLLAGRLFGAERLAVSRAASDRGDWDSALSPLRELTVREPLFPGLAQALFATLLGAGEAALQAEDLDLAAMYCGEALALRPADQAASQCSTAAIPTPTPLPTATSVPTPVLPPAVIPPTAIRPAVLPTAAPPAIPPTATLRPPPAAQPTATLRPPPT